MGKIHLQMSPLGKAVMPITSNFGCHQWQRGNFWHLLLVQATRFLCTSELLLLLSMHYIKAPLPNQYPRCLKSQKPVLNLNVDVQRKWNIDLSCSGRSGRAGVESQAQPMFLCQQLQNHSPDSFSPEKYVGQLPEEWGNIEARQLLFG